MYNVYTLYDNSLYDTFICTLHISSRSFIKNYFRIFFPIFIFLNTILEITKKWGSIDNDIKMSRNLKKCIVVYIFRQNEVLWFFQAQKKKGFLQRHFFLAYWQELDKAVFIYNIILQIMLTFLLKNTNVPILNLTSLEAWDIKIWKVMLSRLFILFYKVMQQN